MNNLRRTELFKTFLKFALISCFVLVFSNNQSTFAEDRLSDNTQKSKRIAVKEFDGDDKKICKMLAEWTISVLMEKKDYKVIERIVLNNILEEQKLALSGLVNRASVSKVGELTGASHLLFGSFGKLGQKYLVTLRIIEVNSAETVESLRGSIENLDDIPDLLVSLINKEKITQNKARNNFNLTGLWDGFFQYDDPRRGYVKGNFSAELNQTSSEAFSGDITEPWSHGFPQNYSSFHSQVIGGTINPDNNQVYFVKKYDYDGHIVEYRGSFVGGNVITGRWNIGSYTGSWRGVRKK